MSWNEESNSFPTVFGLAGLGAAGTLFGGERAATVPGPSVFCVRRSFHRLVNEGETVSRAFQRITRAVMDEIWWRFAVKVTGCAVPCGWPLAVPVTVCAF